MSVGEYVSSNGAIALGMAKGNGNGVINNDGSGMALIGEYRSSTHLYVGIGMSQYIVSCMKA